MKHSITGQDKNGKSYTRNLIVTKKTVNNKEYLEIGVDETTFIFDLNSEVVNSIKKELE